MNNKVIVFLAFTFFCSVLYAQEDKNGVDIEELREGKIIIKETYHVHEEKPFASVEQMPTFKEGETAMMEFIKSNLIYPKISAENGVQGRVVLKFVIMSNGEVSDVEVVRNLEQLCDEEAVRLVKSMPAWNPGKQNGKVVPVYFRLPITFKLGADKNTDPIYNEEEVDEKAKFNGDLNGYFKENYEELNLPTKGGKITVTFVIEIDGSISNVRLIKSLSPEYDSAAVKFIKSMPKWIPAVKDGIVVRNIQHINFNITYLSDQD